MPPLWLPLMLAAAPSRIVAHQPLLASRWLFSLIVKGSIVGLAVATAAILLIWWLEWRRGRIW